VQRKYKGLALDRFIVSGLVDPYHLQWALAPGKDLGIPLVILLDINREVAMERADARAGEPRPKSMQGRMIEHRAFYEACTKVYTPMKVVRRVSCDGRSKDQVNSIIIREVMELQRQLQQPTYKAPTLPPYVFHDGLSKLSLIDDFKLFTQLKGEMHGLFHDTGYIDSAPASSMSGIIDAKLFQKTVTRKQLSTYFVTLKADGVRMLLMRHKKHGLILFPFAFHCALDANAMFANVVWGKPPANSSATPTTTAVEFVLDCEAVTYKNQPPVVMVFDAIWFYGYNGKTTLFSKRYELLKEYFGANKDSATAQGQARPPPNKICVLKEYAPIKSLRTLLPDYHKPPFPIDGIVFQHDGYYAFGNCRDLFKWKPSEDCSADFRLYGGVDPGTGNENAYWKFQGKVQVPLHVGSDEETFPNAEIWIRAKDVDAFNISDGTIVEAVKRTPQKESGGRPQTGGKQSAAQQPRGGRGGGGKEAEQPSNPALSIWDFRRTRPDKVLPNKLEIVEMLNSIDHLTYEQLVASCEKL